MEFIKEVLEVKQTINTLYVTTLKGNDILKFINVEFDKKNKPHDNLKYELVYDLPLIVNADSKSFVIKDNKLYYNNNFKKAIGIENTKILETIYYCNDRTLLETIDFIVHFYFDLTNPYEAFVSYNFKNNIDSNLTMDKSKFNFNEEKAEEFAPDKLAIFLTRKLNIDRDFIFYDNLEVIREYNNEYGSKKPITLFAKYITKAISYDVEADKEILFGKKFLGIKNTRKDLMPDYSPLREYYVNVNDLFIYTLFINLFNCYFDIYELNNKNDFDSISAKMDNVIPKLIENKDISVRYIKTLLELR